MFQGPKGYITQICEVHLQYGNSTTKWQFFTLFFRKFPSNIYSILFVKHVNMFILETWFTCYMVCTSRYLRGTYYKFCYCKDWIFEVLIVDIYHSVLIFLQ